MGGSTARLSPRMWRAVRAKPCPPALRRRTNQREDRSSLSRKIKENVNGVKFKHRGSSHDHNIYEFTFYHFGCIWKMCAFTMFHPFEKKNKVSVLGFCRFQSVHCSLLFRTLWNQIDLCRTY